MRHKFTIAVGSILVVGGALFASGALIDGSAAIAFPDGSSPAVSSFPGGASAATAGTPDTAAPDGGAHDLVRLDVGEFTRVDVGVTATDIQITAGDGYAVTYQMPENETLKQAEVMDGTLYFFTEVPENGGSGVNSGGQLNITVPRDTELGDLSLKTVSGGIRLEGLACDGILTESVSGNVVCQDLTVGSGEIQTVSGDVQCDARLDSLAVDTVSGDCTVGGTVTAAVDCSTTSGEIRITAPDADVQATSVSGEINCDGILAEDKLSVDGTGCRLTLRSTSGDIAVNR